MLSINAYITEINWANNAIQGTGGQRGFSEFILAAKFTGYSKLVAVNPACP